MVLVRNSIKNQKRGLTVILILGEGTEGSGSAPGDFFFFFKTFVAYGLRLISQIMQNLRSLLKF